MTSGNDQRDLGELSSKQQATGVAERVPLGMDVNVGDEGERLDTAILIKGIVSYVMSI